MDVKLGPGSGADFGVPGAQRCFRSPSGQAVLGAGWKLRGLGWLQQAGGHWRRTLVQLLWDQVWIQRSHPGTPLHCPAPLGGRVKLAALGLCRCTVDNKIAASSEGRKGSEVLKSPRKVGVSWSLQSRHLGEFLPRSCLLCHNSPGLLTHAGVRLVCWLSGEQSGNEN